MRTLTRLPPAVIAGLTLAACSGSESVAPDTDPPVIVISVPTATSTYLTGETAVTVSGTASDDRGVTGVSYQVSGGPSGSAVGTTSWSIAGLALSAGQNLLTVTAVDEAGNASAATLTIESDSEGPTLTIEAPSTSGTHYTNQSKVTLAGRAIDPNGVDRVEFAVTGGTTGVATGTTEWTVEDLGLTEDESEITITARDQLGNSSAVNLTVILDTEPPTVQFETPTVSTAYATIEGGIMISGTAADAVGLDRVEWSIDGGPSQVAEGSESWSVGVVDLAVGESEVTVIAHDRADNTTPTSMSVTRFVAVGPLSLDPAAILTDRADPVLMSVRLDPALVVGPGGVWLFRVDDANQTVDDGVQLLDDGSAFSGDNLLGDAVYSGLVEIAESTPTEVRLQAVVDVQGTGPGRSTIAKVRVLAPTSAPADAIQIAVQQDAVEELDALLGQGSELASAVDQVVEFLESEPGVASATGSATSIRIEYESGLRGGLFLIRPLDGEGIALSRSEPPSVSPFDSSTLWDRLLPPRVRTPSSVASTRAGPRIPPHLQTVGRALSPGGSDPMMMQPPEDVILQPSIVMALPYWSARLPAEMNLVGQIIGLLFGETLFRGSTFGSDGVPVSAFRELTEAGVVMLSTRGSQGLVIATGEIATPQMKDAYGALRQSGQIGVWTDVALAPDAAGAQIQGDEFVLYPEFIRNLPRTFPGSLILNLSGESTMSTELADAFFSKGAETYFGFDRNVSSLFAASAAGQILQPMVSPQRLTTGQAFVPGQQDPFLDGATFEMIGNDRLHLPTEFLNGTFESGDLTGWAFGFNGTRAISQLGPVLPPSGEYMSLVSTGIGLEEPEDPGLLGQTFLVPQDASTLSMKWNFLSEEFLESIGTSYQDSFTIVVTRGITTQPLVQIEMTIDGLAETFGCTDSGGPDCQLIPVSPDIVFDFGDVYMTDWQTTELDVTPYRGQLLTIYVVVANAEDSTYHSAVLLDDFVLQ